MCPESKAQTHLTTIYEKVSQGRTRECNIKCTFAVVALWADRYNFNSEFTVKAV